MSTLYIYHHTGDMPCEQCGKVEPHTHELTEDQLRKIVQTTGAKVETYQPSRFTQEVMVERHRQQAVEGFTVDGDIAAYPMSELIRAAVSYAAAADPTYGMNAHGVPAIPPPLWPWDASWWKPVNRKRALIKAAALLLAEGDRLEGLARLATADIEKTIN